MALITQITANDILHNESTVIETFRTLRDAGRGHDATNFLENFEGFAHYVYTANNGADTEISVYFDDNDTCYLVGDVHGPWVVRFEIAREWTTQDLADQYHANFFSLPSEYDRVSLSVIHDEINDQLERENEWLEWSTFVNWAEGQLRVDRPNMAE